MADLGDYVIGVGIATTLAVGSAGGWFLRRWWIRNHFDCPECVRWIPKWFVGFKWVPNGPLHGQLSQAKRCLHCCDPKYPYPKRFESKLAYDRRFAALQEKAKPS